MGHLGILPQPHSHSPPESTRLPSLPCPSVIFSTLIDWWLKKFSYQPTISKLSKPLVAATLEVYESAQRELLPTPTKSHYTFNLRDVSKVFQVRQGRGKGDQRGPPL